MKPSDLYCVVLAGGKGERLWPYSRSSRPKHLVPFWGKESLLEQTVKRCGTVTKNIWIVTSAEQNKLVHDLTKNNVKKIIVEPFARNTAAAILLSSFYLKQENPEAIVAFFPSDHFIPDAAVFASKIKKTFSFTYDSDQICLLGLKPTYPAAGYGYIEAEVAFENNGAIMPVKKFNKLFRWNRKISI